MKNVLVLCTGNSCRSQIAHGYLEYFTDGRQVKVYSAGVETHGVNPKAIATMQEDNIDISYHTSNNIEEYFAPDQEFIIFENVDEAIEKINFYEKNPTAYTKLLNASKDRVWNTNTVYHQWDSIMHQIDEHYKTTNIKQILTKYE